MLAALVSRAVECWLHWSLAVECWLHWSLAVECWLLTGGNDVYNWLELQCFAHNLILLTKHCSRLPPRSSFNQGLSNIFSYFHLLINSGFTNIGTNYKLTPLSKVSGKLLEVHYSLRQFPRKGVSILKSVVCVIVTDSAPTPTILPVSYDTKRRRGATHIPNVLTSQMWYSEQCLSCSG